MKSFSEYKAALGYAEGSGNYKADNGKGFIGKYQFGKKRLKDLGYTGSANNFKSNPELQEKIFLLHVKNHGNNLLKYLSIAKRKLGLHVTLSGLIAGAHLKGLGQIKYFDNCSNSGVIQYILYGKDCADGNGTKISTYVNKFSGYEIPGFKETEIKIIDNHFPDQKKIIENNYVPFILIGLGLFIALLVFKKYK